MKLYLKQKAKKDTNENIKFAQFFFLYHVTSLHLKIDCYFYKKKKEITF